MTSTSWPIPPFIRASIALHGMALATAIAVPQTTLAAIGAVAINHLVLTGAGLWPRSRLLGPNITHLGAAAAARGEVAITIDDGPDPQVTPAVLDLLDQHGQRATFFCIGRLVSQHPALARAIVERGHSVQNHSATHSRRFSLLGPKGFMAEISRAQAEISQATGQNPICFRAPAGLRNPLLDPVLHRLGLQLTSWTRRGFDTREGDAGTVLKRLTSGLVGGDILLLHDGHAARTASGQPVVLEVLPGLCDRLSRAGLRSVTLPEALAAVR